MKIKHVYGNVLKLDIPLTIKIRTMDGDVPTEREEPFYPDVSKGCAVILGSSYNRKIQYEATVNGNVAHIEDDGVIGIGTYKVTVKCYDEEGNPYRYMVRDIIEICDATIDAGIEAGVEFNAETYTLEGAVFVSYGGGSYEQVQADWAEDDIRSKAYIKHKPTNLVEDESYVHTDNNYTDEEKEKLANLENYDDSGIRQELDGKEDRTVIAATSTAINVLNAEVGKYHRIDVAVGTLAVTLPAVTDTTHISNIVFMLTTDSTPAVTFTAPSGINVYYQDGFEIEAGSTYEINALFNGAAWIVAAVKINVE